jgi:hypothetical protein
MEKKIRRNLLISLFFLVLIIFPIPLIVYNVINSNPELYSIRIEGNVSEVTTYSYDQIVEGSFGLVENQNFVFLNQYDSQYNRVYTGVSVWSLLTYITIMYPNSTGISFKSYDSYVTETLTLEQININPELVIIAFKIDDRALKYNDNDGGPLRSIVDLSVTDPVYCSKYWVKHVNTIVVI